MPTPISDKERLEEEEHPLQRELRLLFKRFLVKNRGRHLIVFWLKMGVGIRACPSEKWG